MSTNCKIVKGCKDESKKGDATKSIVIKSIKKPSVTKEKKIGRTLSENKYGSCKKRYSPTSNHIHMKKILMMETDEDKEESNNSKEDYIEVFNKSFR